MYELPKLIPDLQVALDLTPEELGAKILFGLRSRDLRQNQGRVNRNNEERGAFLSRHDELASYQSGREEEFALGRVDEFDQA